MSTNRHNQPFTMGANLGEGWSSDNKTPVAKTEKILAVDKHELKIKKEKRKGKTVTLVGEFFHSGEIKKKVAAELKKKLSTGGSAVDNWIELQGDVGEKAREILTAMGYRFK